MREGVGGANGQMIWISVFCGRPSSKLQAKRYGDRGAAYAAIAGSLNSSQRLPWDTDKQHVQGRLQHLTVARRTHQRASARATGVEEEHRELEELLADIIGKSDEFMASEAG
jgi:hypothetical protein